MDLNDMPITVIWTAHEMMREDADGEEMTLPLLPGGKNQYEMSMWVTSIMHVVGRVGMKSVQTKAGVRTDRGVYFSNQPPIRARDRTGTLQDSMLIARGHKVVTTFPEIMGIIEAGGSAALERAEAMVEARTDDPDEADIIEPSEEDDAPGSVPDGDGDETTPPDAPKAPAKRPARKRTSGRTFRPADEED
jgi:hypothetical protein